MASRGIWWYMGARTRKSLVLFWTALFVFSLALQYANFVVAPAPVAAAINTDVFQLDGNATDDGAGDDWANIFIGPNSADQSTFITDGFDANDDIFTGGSSKDINDVSAWLWKVGSVQDKDDIEHAFAAQYTVGSEKFVYFGLDRFQTSGDATAGFWFFQNPVGKTGAGTPPGSPFSGVHTNGDVLVVLDFTNGGATATAAVYMWMNGALVLDDSGGKCAPGTLDDVCAISNEVEVDSPWPYTPKQGTANKFPANALLEGGINLTALGFGDECFSTFLAETRSSQETTATLSDFALGSFDTCGSVTIVKDAVPNDAQDFTFGGSFGNFSLDDDADATLSNTAFFNNVNPGTYTVTETDIPAGWDLTSISCNDGGSATPSTVNLGTATATINVDPVEDVTCTFTNTKRGKIIIEKQTNPDAAPGSFSFTGEIVTSLSDNGTAEKGNLIPGTYTVTEGDPTPPFDLGAITCDDGGSATVSTGNLETRTATFRLDPGETVTCTFLNVQRGTITIIKDAVPNDDQDFTYTTTGTGLSGFTLDDNGNNGDGTSNTKMFANVTPGSYSVTEQAVAGWDLTGLVCEGTAGSTGVPNGATANITLTAGGSVTCTYENTKRGQIIIDKVTNPSGDPASFEFDPSYGDNFNLTDTAAPDESALLVPGTYTVEELAKAGWDLTGLSCVDQSGGTTTSLTTRTATIGLAAGETVTCTFTNTKRGTITIVKDAIPNDEQDFSYLTSGTGLSGFTLDDNGNNGDGTSNTKTFENLLPGSYGVTEQAVAGWDLTDLDCTASPGSSGVPSGATANITLAAGGSVTCTYENTKRGTVIVEKVMVGGTDTFTYTGTPSGAIATNNGTISQEVTPGQYISTEQATAGWDLTSVVCSDANSVGSVANSNATFNVEPGETVTCTFTNTKRGQIIIDKVTNPSGDPASFTFDPSYGDNFSLTDAMAPNASALLEPGQYTVEELAKAGWDLTALACDDANSTEDLGARTATINLEAGETVTCTFTNTKRGTIIVEKQTSPDGAEGDFTFTGTAAGTISDNGTITVGNLVPGQYTSTENDPTPSFDLGSIVCNDGASTTPSTWSVETRTATFELDPGETVKCTFTNVQRGTITIIKNTIPDGPQDFHFNTTGSGLSGFDLDDDNNATLSNTKTFENVVAGDYSVTEVAVPGWDLTGIECVSAGGSSTTTEDATASITMVPGGSVTCTYTNVERGSITIVKDAKPNDAQDFHFDFTGSELPGPIAFDLDDDADATLPSQITIPNLIPGTYTATEAATAGWDLTQIVCNDTDGGTTIDGASAIIDLDPGQHIICTFENRKPDIQIVKTAGDAEDGEVYVTEAFDDNVTYHYEVTNTGEVDLFDVVVVDDAGTPLDTDDDIEICVIEELPIGATETCVETLTVLVDTINVAVASGETDQGTEVSDEDDAEVDIVAPAIEIIKTAGDAEDGEVYVTEAFPSNVTYTYEITNTGEVDLFGVEVVDDNGTPANTADDHVVCTIDELPIGESDTCTLTLTVNQTTTNVAVATGHTEQQPEEDVSDDDDAVVRVPDTGIDKSNNDADGVVGHGQEVTYTILVEVVQGPVTNAVVTDTLPVGQTYVANSQTSNPAASNFTVSANGRTLTWTYASLPSGDPAVTITYKVTIDASAPTGNQTNVAEICVSELEDCKTDDTTVRVPLLTIVKSFVGNTGGTAPDGSPEAKVGDVLTYTLAYDLTNGPVTNGVITDTLPVGLAYVNGSATNNAEFTFQSFNAATRTLTWTAPTVTADGTVTYQALVLVDADELPQPLVNIATIDSDETDKDDDDARVFVEPQPLAETATPTLPPTDSLYTAPQGSSNPGHGLMLLLLALGGFALVIGFITPVPERARRRGRLG